jgi:hypothetical protein
MDVGSGLAGDGQFVAQWCANMSQLPAFMGWAVDLWEQEKARRPITEQEIREALDAMVEKNGGHPISVEGTWRVQTVKAKKPFK